MQKKQLTIVIVSLLVVVLSVSLAYFTTQIIGKGKKVEVSSTNLQIVFTDTDGAISGSNIEPGWSDTKTFTVENNSKSEYKYNIVIKDLMNTFVTTGYLQYKITSTNGGYNMADYKDVPKSDTAKDKILAYSVSIPVSETQTYTIEFRYLNDEDVDQGDDMGKVLKGTLFITEGTEDIHGDFEEGTLTWQLLDDHSTRLTRTDFSTVLTTDNTKTLYTATEDDTTVYYFAGNAQDNWVKFGGYYWRIIRTNSDGGVRLLYHGTKTDDTAAYIGTSPFNKPSNDSMYVGYMYGTSGSQESNRTNTNNSTIKTAIDNWYSTNMTSYTKYLSTTAVYCNDREVGSGTYSATGSTFYYAAYTRLYTNKTPTYDCTATEDKFTVDTSTGNGKLTYPIALMTADEMSYAGGKYISCNANAWYIRNANDSTKVIENKNFRDPSTEVTPYYSTGTTYWWLLSPDSWYSGRASVIGVYGSSYPGYSSSYIVESAIGVRPALSLKSCVKTNGGDGTPENPCTIEETASGC